MSTAVTTKEEVHEHHHKETFITKYVFSQDHKMIAKQYLITGLFMGIIGIAMSLLFRVQLAWPEQSFKIFEVFLGKWAPEGVIRSPELLYSWLICYMARRRSYMSY